MLIRVGTDNNNGGKRADRKWQKTQQERITKEHRKYKWSGNNKPRPVFGGNWGPGSLYSVLSNGQQ